MVPDSTTDRLLPALVEIVGSDNVLRPAPAQYLTDETGRGLELVSLLATRWGARAAPEGKIVWAEIDLP